MMKTRSFLILALLIVLSSVAFSQATYSVSAVPVTANAAGLVGAITFTDTDGPSAVGMIAIQYGGPGSVITSPASNITVLGPAVVDAVATALSLNVLVLDVVGGSTAPITVGGVWVRVPDTGIVRMQATISTTVNAIVAGQTSVVVVTGGQTVLMLPYASTQAGFDTGIAISNTTRDPGTAILGLSGAVPQSGPVTFYLYPEVGNPFSYAAGNLAAGKTYVALLSQILAEAGRPAAFSGYVIAVTGFADASGVYTVSNFSTLSAFSGTMSTISAR